MPYILDFYCNKLKLLTIISDAVPVLILIFWCGVVGKEFRKKKKALGFHILPFHLYPGENEATGGPVALSSRS